MKIVHYEKNGRNTIQKAIDRAEYLLCGGSKNTQQRDIDKAVEYLQNFKKEN